MPAVGAFSHREAVLRKLTAILALVGLVLACRGSAQTTPEIALETVLTGLAQPTSITHAGDARLFLTLQRGRIVIVDGGRLLPTVFLDIEPLVSCCGERGLLGLAFHPRYAENGLFFVDYTNGAGNTVIARYRVSPSNPNAADPAGAVILMTIDQPFANHNGGQLAFGPDGYLSIGMGDGGSANDPMCNAQRDETLLGKILRIDVDANVNTPPFYGIPPENPFAAPGGARDEIWAKGLRNPWRFSFDRLTGDLYIGDVGQGAREEVDFQPAGNGGGANYGWKVMEGTACGGGGTTGCPGGVPACNSPGLVGPILEYSHSGGDCSVTGGYVYRGRLFSQLTGTYFYGDYCTGKIWGATRGAGGGWTTRLFSPRAGNLTTFGEDAEGELYLATEGGLLARIVDANPPAAPVLVSIEPASGSARGGDSLVITGGNFLTGVTVSFGEVAAPSVAILDSIGTRLQITTPAHAAGPVDVVVTNPDGRSATLPGGYNFTAPVRVSKPLRIPRTVTPRS
ncbi:MAG TPA: PQQ-dependent sugar dehydrogenase [Thermoanaerobaculia bacterium]|jgi:glucose/arabinose dehydrogenase|nr:PQQ-dependent sugar dehydrogenase [Thermoanaerobaculia bacterium]